MAQRTKKPVRTSSTTATVGYEARLWQQACAPFGLDGQIADGDAFQSNHLTEIEVGLIRASPPFSVSDWGGERLAGAPRCECDSQPTGNANFAGVRYIVRLLTPAGLAGSVLTGRPMLPRASSGPT